MTMAQREVIRWVPPGRRPAPGLEALVHLARAEGGACALTRWSSERPGLRTAHVHGERHTLWWEFRLSDSFRWQGHLSRQRTQRLAALFGLTAVLDRAVEELSPAERARADLAVALSARPELLVWEEPFRLLSGPEHTRVIQAVLELCRTEGITVLAVAAETPGLRGLGVPALQVCRAAR